MDEPLAARNGKKKQSLKSRRDESKAMNKLNTGKSFASVGTMDKPKKKAVKKVMKKMVTKPKPTAKARTATKLIKKAVRKASRKG